MEHDSQLNDRLVNRIMELFSFFFFVFIGRCHQGMVACGHNPSHFSGPGQNCLRSSLEVQSLTGQHSETVKQTKETKQQQPTLPKKEKTNQPNKKTIWWD